MKKYLQSIYAGFAITFIFLLMVGFFIIVSVLTMLFALFGQLQKQDIETVKEDVDNVFFRPDNDIYGGQ